MNTRFVLLSSLSLVAAVAACGDTVIFSEGPIPEDDGGATVTTSTGMGGNAQSVTVTTATTTGMGGFPATTSVGGSPTTTSVTTVGVGGAGGGSCEDVTASLNPTPQPVDAIVAVVNSSVTSGPIGAVEQQLNNGFVQPLVNQGYDLQTILISDHGNFGSQICMPPPLGNGACNGPPVNGPTFKQYSTLMPLGGAVCRLLDTIDGSTPDDFGFASGGWQQWLRPNAFKAFIVFDANGVGCVYDSNFINDQDDDFNGQQVATLFDGELLSNYPGQFGSSAQRRYGVYFAGGIGQNANNTAYTPELPTVFTTCGGQFSAPGTGYQWLSKGTQSLRFSGCNNANLPPVFTQTATHVAGRAVDACTLTFTPPPDFTPTFIEGTNFKEPIVPNSGACGTAPGGYVSGPGEVKLCPASCAVIQANPIPLQLTEPCDVSP